MKKYLLIIILIELLASCSSLKKRTYDQGTIKTQIDSLLADFKHAGNVEVAASAHRYDFGGGTEELYFKNFSDKVLGAKKDRKYNTGSLGKSFTGAAISLLQQQNPNFKATDKISKYITEWPEYAKDVTIDYALRHLSGLPDYMDSCPMQDSHKVMKFVNKKKELDPLVADDGTKTKYDVTTTDKNKIEFRYSNTAFVVLANVVEAVSGKTFPVFMRENFFSPMGMNETFIREVNGPKTDAVPAFRRTGAIFTNGGCFWIYGDGGVLTTLGDLAKWNRIYAGTSNILDADALKRMTHWNAVSETFGDYNFPANETYGYGLYTNQVLQSSDRFPGNFGQRHIRHGGVMNGSHTYFLYFPVEKISVVVLINGAGAADLVGDLPNKPDRQMEVIADNIARIIFTNMQVSN
ncbi:MAG: beta-lactamase family protein [Bdellovibrionaceae bacterium]|nr:beta-lactamase family protein [Pseudobdellovibrionaceae bacterium]